MRSKEHKSRDQSDALIDTKGRKKEEGKKEFEFLSKRTRRKKCESSFVAKRALTTIENLTVS